MSDLYALLSLGVDGLVGQELTDFISLNGGSQYMTASTWHLRKEFRYREDGQTFFGCGGGRGDGRSRGVARPHTPFKIGAACPSLEPSVKFFASWTFSKFR